DNAGNPLDNIDALPLIHNRVTQLNGIRWRYDVHGRTVEKDNGHTRWQYRYDTEHRLTDVVSLPRNHNAPQIHVSFRYDPLGRRISKTRRQTLHGEPQGKTVTTQFIWEGFRLLQEIQNQTPLTYVYSAPDSYEPLARIDGVASPEIFWFHCQPNGTPERLTDAEGRLRWEGRNSAWGKLLHESPLPGAGIAQNLRMQGQYLDRETGLHYNLFRYYDPDCGRFTQPDPIGLAGGINLYQYAPNALGWVDPLGLSPVSPNTILFSQDSINPIFDDGRNVNELIHRLKNDPSYISQVEPIRKVRMRDLPNNVQDKLLSQGAHKDSVFSLDNRRLYAAKEAGVSKIPSRWATPDELSKINLERRFSTKNGGKSIRTRGCG
ncbi:RHS repeat-associated core domain-containing protein, partial [Brenneria goodwinii]